MTNQDSIQQLFKRQKEQALKLRSAPVKERIKRLAQLQYWIENHQNEIQEALYEDFRKPAMEVNLTEIYPALSEVRLAISNVDDWAFPKKVKSPATFMAASARIHYEPKGVCLIISPWNYPFILAIGPLISALAAGNTVILKPSEHSPNTSRLIESMVSDLFDPSDVAVFQGEVEVAQALLELPFDHIFFTGSTQIGKKVMAAASEHLASVTLELGGKSPVIIAASASPGESAERISWGKFLNTGQTCIAPDYAFIHSSQWDTFLKEFVFYTEKLYGQGGKEFADSGDYARIINKSHFDRLSNALDEALDAGATLICGGKRNEEELYFEPTVIANVPEDCTLMQEEIFGPILPVKSYSELEEVITYINSRPKPLASYLFAQDEPTYNKVLQETSAGALVYNDCVIHFTHPNLPFGGVNASGIGKAHGKHGFDSFSNEKAVIKQRLPMNKLVYPPYTQVTGKFINYMLKYL